MTQGRNLAGSGEGIASSPFGVRGYIPASPVKVLSVCKGMTMIVTVDCVQCDKYVHVASVAILDYLPEGYNGELCPNCNAWVCEKNKIGTRKPAPVINDNGITVRQLKSFLEDYPDRDEYGEEYGVWIDKGSGLSSPARSLHRLNKHDIILGFEES